MISLICRIYKTKLIGPENRLVVTREEVSMGEEDREVQTSSYKMNKLWWHKYSTVTTLSDIMLQIWKLLLHLKSLYHKIL